MFEPKTDRIKELMGIFDKKTNIYIDFANVIRWQDKLKWHIDLKRLKQFFDSFDTINLVKFYSGTLVGNIASEKFIEDIRSMKYDVHTKPVKIMNLSIDVSSIPIDSPILLRDFIRKPFWQSLI